ncbi:molybdopterin-binding protein [Desulfovibrio desulfuricans]|uniref:Molybdopterin molybdenumtransferase n=2 Tax=Desulfovibrio desulfuricans TaxID=876 RepID=A0A4P7UHA0_DESDE|nr:molybdopterin-binding protein [Desulfovibrio desulfuricans]QCC84857.1 molybdopterin-binding protein [Desulfovibrio desulfuricans]
MSKLAMKTIQVHDAVGSVLCHDITRIVPGESKGPVFRKGHVVRQEDVEVLLQVGKEHLYVFESLPGMVHENDAAARVIAAVAGSNLVRTDPKEGRIDLLAACDGLLRIDVPVLNRINSLGEISVATIHSMQHVTKGRPVAGSRVVPLMIEDEKLRQLESLVTGPVIEVLPLRRAKVGVVTTGSEVFYGRIQDAFGPVLRKKFAALGSAVVGQTLTSDEVSMTAGAIRDFLEQGADLIVVTGGMSVDPDDRTPTAIRASGAEVASYGAPVYPGAMFLLAYAQGAAGRVPVLGLPGCVMYHKASIFDLIVPRLLAGIEVTSADVAALGHGGFCAQCEVCRYPVCPFGK